jgi:hypothetical protein
MAPQKQSGGSKKNQTNPGGGGRNEGNRTNPSRGHDNTDRGQTRRGQPGSGDQDTSSGQPGGGGKRNQPQQSTVARNPKTPDSTREGDASMQNDEDPLPRGASKTRGPRSAR